MTLQLHGHLFSSYCWKALIALYANDTPFEFVAMADDRPLSAQFAGKAHPGATSRCWSMPARWWSRRPASSSIWRSTIPALRR